MNYAHIVGQIIGVITVVIGFLSYQTKTAKKLLVLQVLTAFLFCIHYFLIDAVSGCILNAIAFVRNAVYANRDKKIFSYRFYPILFAVIMAFAGIFTWQNSYSILVILGLVVNTLCLPFKDPQNIRKSILVSSTMVLIYNIAVFSIGGAVYESVVILSSAIGLLRYRTNKQNS